MKLTKDKMNMIMKFIRNNWLKVAIVLLSGGIAVSSLDFKSEIFSCSKGSAYKVKR